MKLYKIVLATIMAIFIIGCGGGSGSIKGSGVQDDNPDVATKTNYYYVATNGLDSNPGTLKKPWATPGYASRQLKPGDTLVILEGTYTLSKYDDDIIKPQSGTKSKWITIRGEKGKRVVLAGRNNLMTAIDLGGKEYIKVENLEITHDATASGSSIYFRDGIEILGNEAKHIILRELKIHHIDEMGLNIQDVDDLQIINCEISYCGFGAIGGPAGNSGGLRNIQIVNSKLLYSGHYYQGGNDARDVYDRPDGFGIESSDGPITIVKTISAHNYGDGIDSKAKNTVISRCIVANNSSDGVKLWGDNSRIENTVIYGRGDGDNTITPWAAIVIDQDDKPNAKFEIVNVTVDDKLGGNYLMYAQYDHPDIPIKLTIKNSIFSARGSNSRIFIGRDTQLTADHNLFYFPNSSIVLSHSTQDYTKTNINRLGTGNRYGDPLFNLPAWGSDGDYRLQNGSPAIDSGSSNNAPTIDINGVSRPQGSGYDIGAYER